MDGNLVSLNELLVGDHLFNIPVYQRGYTWETKHCKDLWEDLYYLDASKRHFIGTVLLKDSGETVATGFKTFKRLDVIDGQQRLTTILILLRQIISQAKAGDDEELRKEVPVLEENYLKYRDHYKLNLLGSDGEFFEDFVIGEKEHLRDDTQTPSQARLVAAKDFFKGKLEEERKKLQPAEFAEFLIKLKRKVDALQLIRYLVNLDADAIRIFETVNDRGRPLSNLEKTKSFLMHISYLGLQDDSDAIEGHLGKLNSYFSHIYRYFEDVSGTKTLGRLSEDDVQRYHFINYVAHDRRQWSTDKLKTRIRDMPIQEENVGVKYALDYANDLKQAFFAVKNIVDTHEKEEELGALLDKVFTVGRLGNLYPLLIALWLKFRENQPEMSKILNLIESFTFRVYTVGGYRSNTAENWLNCMAHNVHQEEWDSDKLIGELERINRYYKDDHWFDRDLHLEDFYNRINSSDIKYLLSEYEIHLRENSGEPLPPSQKDILSNNFQVEHIWAADPSRLDLKGDMVEWHGQNKHKLGNLTLASQSWNASMGNNPFEEKCLKYKDSSLRVQRELANLGEWNPDTIKEREDRIVEFALKRWSV